MQSKKQGCKTVSFLIFFTIIISVLLSGCMQEEEQADPSLLVLDSLQVKTRSGYTDEFYKNSVLEVFITATNKDVISGTFTLTFYIDDEKVDEKEVLINASEDKTVKLTNLNLSTVGFPLIIKGLNETGDHIVRVNNVSKDIVVQEPPIEVDIQTIDWIETKNGWRPWITLEVYNTENTLFYLGQSFAIETSKDIYLGTIESWDLIHGDKNLTGFYPLPPNGLSEVEFTSYDLISNSADGSDILLEGIIVYAGFPWMDATAGIIGEQKIV